MPRPRIKPHGAPAATRLVLLLLCAAAVARAFLSHTSSITTTGAPQQRRRPCGYQQHCGRLPLTATTTAATAAATAAPLLSTADALHGGGGDGGGKTLLSLSPTELAAALGGNGRARMVWRALAEGFDPQETDTTSPLYDGRITPKTRALLGQRLARPGWAVVERVKSDCGTVKMVVRLADGLMVETVAIPAATRTTVCVSSQVGCAQACEFCSTGKMGLLRNLALDEILVQYALARQVIRLEGLPDQRTNVVFMGMGEPLANPQAVRAAVGRLVDAYGFALSPNFVTVSTVGPSPAAIARLVDMPRIKLAWSVHAADDALRRALVPTTSSSMAELREAFLAAMAQHGDEELFVEVTLIDGVNDSVEEAARLVEFLRPMGRDRVKVNLIPYNDINVNGWRPSPLPSLQAFQAVVRGEGGWYTTIRTPRGRDEAAACGQLATEVAAEARGKRRASPAGGSGNSGE